MRRLAALLLVPLLALVAGCGDDDDAAGGSFCDRAQAVDRQFDALDEEFGGNDLPSAAALDEAADVIADLADGAPDEIQGDLTTFADGIREIVDLFAEIDLTDAEALSDPENAAALQAMNERMEGLDAEMDEATENVGRYLQDECGIDIEG